jgi:hypothetical protein
MGYNIIMAIEHNNLRIVDLLKLSTVNRQLFEKQVAAHSGQLKVLFHPFINDQNPEDKFPVTSEYLECRDELIKDLLTNDEPLVIFEGVDAFGDLAKRVGGIVERGLLFTVKTVSNDPTPFLGLDSPVVHILPLLDHLAWGKVARVFRQANVLTVEVGGRYMVLKDVQGIPDDTDQEILINIGRWSRGLPDARRLANSGLVPYECAGIGMLELLKRGFDTKISTASSPSFGLIATDLSRVRQRTNIFL